MSAPSQGLAPGAVPGVNFGTPPGAAVVFDNVSIVFGDKPNRAPRTAPTPASPPPRVRHLSPASTVTIASDDSSHDGLLLVGDRGVQREVLRVLAEGEEADDLDLPEMPEMPEMPGSTE